MDKLAPLIYKELLEVKKNTNNLMSVDTNQQFTESRIQMAFRFMKMLNLFPNKYTVRLY